MQFITNPVYVLAVLLLLIAFSEWLGQRKYFRHLGSALIVILATAILANAHILPSSQNAPPLYDDIFKYIAPLAIFFLLLDVKLKYLRQAGPSMMTMFLTGSVCTILGAILGYYFISPQHHHVNYANAVAGMYTGTYIGGSANLQAVAFQYGVNKDGTLFAAVNVVDNIITTLWIMVTIIIPPILQRLLPRKRNIPVQNGGTTKEELVQQLISKKEEVSVKNISLLLALGLAALFLSNLLTYYFPRVPSILTLTTMALLLAQIPAIQELKGGKVMGYFLVLLFLAVIGAYCDINALLQSGKIAAVLLSWVTIIVLVHGVLLFTIGGLFKQDWDIVSIASNANIGGTASAAVLATSLGRPDLRLPGILAGAVGNAIGTYAGILVAEFLK
ncbi:MAG: DUF819 domain-containing protein [Chitinophagales bacterium]